MLGDTLFRCACERRDDRFARAPFLSCCDLSSRPPAAYTPANVIKRWMISRPQRGYRYRTRDVSIKCIAKWIWVRVSARECRALAPNRISVINMANFKGNAGMRKRSPSANNNSRVRTRALLFRMEIRRAAANSVRRSQARGTFLSLKSGVRRDGNLCRGFV